MSNLISEISAYMAYPFVRYALIVGVLVALCSSLLGVILVLKRYSFIGDGLSHVAFGALAIASVLRISNEMIVVLPITVICAVILLCTKSSSKIKGDSALAMTSVGTLAIGYLLMNIFPTSSNINGDVCGTLFGSTLILKLTISDVWLCVVLSLAVILFFVVFYHKIFAITFDENFALSVGIKTRVFNFLTALICAVIIVLAMNLAGSLLTSALIVFPAISAMRVFKSFRAVIVCSGVLAVVCAFFGIILSILFSTPVGSTVVAADIVAFALFCVIGKIKH